MQRTGKMLSEPRWRWPFLPGVGVWLLLGSVPCAAADTSFSEQVLPLLNSHCLMCHMPGAAQAELSLYPDAWQNLVGQPSTQSSLLRVKPGDAGASYLWRKLNGTQLEAGGSGEHMPYQRELLQDEDLAAVRSWIEQGAKNN